MPFYLRIISKSRWLPIDDSWLNVGEFQGDVLVDLRTQSNCLSVWFIDDERSNLSRVATALAAKRDKVGNFDYALIDEEVLTELQIRKEKNNGDSPDSEINSSVHYDCVELSAQKIVKLAKRMFSCERDRILEKTIREQVLLGIKQGHINESKLKAGFFDS